MEERTRHLMAQLPYLRRYARALAGSPADGDALVTRALEWYLDREGEDAGEHGGTVPLRMTLYRHLNTLQDDRDAPAATSAHPVEAALGALGETDRRLYLLVNLEDLAAADAAAVLDLPAGEGVERLARAREAVRARLAATILIVEDDAIIAFDLAETVRSMGHIVCGTAATMDEALGLAAEHTPTLALMDIRLAEGDNGIEVARELRRQRFLPVIFVTAFPEDVVRRGVEYLGPVIPKPFTREQIEQAITRAVFTPAPEEGRAMVPPVA
ncbi:PhyR family response regulator anti-anti-sigma factor [Azospirillum halopraeferens]|uniref:PhyR family response regulator anti-anti-sigma factor n=1 Tax=Azospirillum halopraeferens TaxID=34010 RepID=UPI00041E423B|nr:response regulator [Azospirillum halopraeferens]